MKPSRLSALVLALVLLSGCGAPPPEATPTPTPEAVEETGEEASTVFTLPRTTASLHPILSTDKVNVALSGLIWEGLFELDRTFDPQLRLCQSYAVSEDGLTWTFRLRSGVTFSDGSPLTAADVVASLQLAQSPQSRFAGRLDDVVSIAEQDGAVVLTLRTPNGALPALLDIPIVKAGSDAVPPGTGPYRLTEADGSAVLTARTDWWRNLDLPAETIPLVTIQAADDLISAFDTEEISLVTADLTGTSTLGFAGDHAVWDYPTTTMVYIGYNCQKGPCANAAIPRRALDRAWDRNTVAVALYSRHAQAAALPLHPDCADYDDILAQRRDYSPQVFAQLLEEAGCTQGEDGLWYQGRQPLSLTFVVNTDNTFRLSAAEYLAGELTRSGVQVELQKLSWAEYQQALTAGSFDLYLGAAALSADFDPAPLLTAGGALNFGGYWNANTLTLLSAWQAASGTARKAAQALWTDLENQVPFSTLCFKSQSVLTQWGTVTGLTPTQQNPFHGIENWRFGS